MTGPRVSRRVALTAGLSATLATVAGFLAGAVGCGPPRPPFRTDPSSTRNVELENRGGIPWYEAPPPPQRHRHWVQTRGRVNGERVERCACGAARLGHGWIAERQPRIGP
jgi:hypothetical protein